MLRRALCAARARVRRFSGVSTQASSVSKVATEQKAAAFVPGEYVHELQPVDPSEDPKIPSYRVMDEEGRVANAKLRHELSLDQLLEMYQIMGQIATIDQIFTQAQRHGRISFHMQNAGEEGLQVGSAAALEPQDHVFAQYRELGVFLWRGFSMQQVAHQCFSNVHDLGKGRQMPMHFGSHALNLHTISSPLTTQLPQAAGTAFALKQRGEDACVACYFGDGAASEGDFHAALNFAATLECPVIFFCRNNGWAISTPVHEQFRGDGILSRAKGYGMYGYRVDGNDMLAVYEATKEAREYAVEQKKPVLLEAMSYRRSHHSSSDDSSTYRPKDELEWWQNNNNPIDRVRMHLEARGAWDSDKEAAMRQSMKKQVVACLNEAERAPKPPIVDLFTDVYKEMPPRLKEQKAALEEHLAKYPEAYNLGKYAKE